MYGFVTPVVKLYHALLMDRFHEDKQDIIFQSESVISMLDQKDIVDCGLAVH